ncbi:tyrosine-type recombinase/integrase [Cellulomonas sp. ICMP 17802]|uniref:tyrosine-type recombinase/integrase n=1 Tax=Cellulomonas sp. ICMP 17802 TaxID=3239199 RepID=UPI00351B6D2F
MTAALTAWRRAAPASPHDLVWPVVEHDDPRMLGRPRSSSSDRDAWYALQESAGVAPTDRRKDRSPARYVLHEARHTTATLLLEGGVDQAVITAIMGHSSIVTSRGYMHVSQALARRAPDDVAVRLGLTARAGGAGTAFSP